MDVKLKEEIFNTDNKEFLDRYFGSLVNRFTYSNMSNSKTTVILNDNMKTFNYLLGKLSINEGMSKELIKTVANMVNSSNPYISNEYRKIGNVIADTDIPISSPDNIDTELSILLDYYNNQWSTLDAYQREALFNFYFIRIHPYEDGNRRTSRLILNFNLLRQGLSPVIITSELNEAYYKCIKYADVDSLARLFREQSLKENEFIDILYMDYCKEKEEHEDNIHKIK